MLSNTCFLAKFCFDTAENEPAKNLQNFPKFSNFAAPTPLKCSAARVNGASAQAGPALGSLQASARSGLCFCEQRPDRAKLVKFQKYANNFY